MEDSSYMVRGYTITAPLFSEGDKVKFTRPSTGVTRRGKVMLVKTTYKADKIARHKYSVSYLSSSGTASRNWAHLWQEELESDTDA